MPRTLEGDLDGLLRALAQGFAAVGDAKSVAILANAKASLEQTDYDNWNGGTYGYTVSLEVPAYLFAAIAEQRDEIEKAFVAKLEPFLRRYPNHYIREVVIVTELQPDPEWREKAKRWLAGEGINNQGRVRSDNIASKQCDGLLFRSQPEINLYNAIKGLGLPFAPLPVFLRGGREYKRIEPDFVIFHRGILLVVEVDGDTVHRELPAEAHARMTILEYEGARVIRVKASDCETLEKAKAWAAALPGLIDRFRTSN